MTYENGMPMFEFLKIKLPNFVREEKGNAKCQNPNHKEYEAVFNIFDDGSRKCATVCPECQKEERLRELKREEARKIQHCKDCNIEPEFYGKTFNDFICKTETQKDALAAAREMLSGKIGKLVLLGSYGTGKTMLASILADLLDGKIYSMYEISTMIRQSYSPKAEKSELDIVNELASIPFLAIDEVGRTNGSAAEKNWLSYILDKRHVRKLPFVLISNGHLRRNCPKNGCDKCFENYMDGDVISRLRQDSKIINIIGEDFRAGK